MKNKLTPQQVRKILNLIRTRLPPKSKILCLSLSGPRIFGWGDKRTPYQIYGIFRAKNFWHRIYFKNNEFEIYLSEFEYFLKELPFRRSLDCSTYFAKPFYLDKKFNYQILLSLLAPVVATEDLKDIIKRFLYIFYPELLLRCYWYLMMQIHYLRTGKIELNIFKLNKNYHFKTISILKKDYLSGKRKSDLKYKEQIKTDLKKLIQEFQKLISKREFKKITFDQEKWAKWKKELEKIYL